MFWKPLDRCLNISDLRSSAKCRAHRMVFDYIDGGSDDEKTLADNSAAFDDYNLHHRVLTGKDNPDTSITLLGQELNVPFILSPAAGNRLFHVDGERGPALAAEEHGTVYTLSTLSSCSIEEISKLTVTPKWFQLYVWRDRALIKDMLDRAKASGYKALVLTVDFPITGNRERDPRNGFTIPPKVGLRQIIDALRAPLWTYDYLTHAPMKYANLSEDTDAISLNQFVSDQLNARFSWLDAEWLLGEWNGPTVIKGVVRPDDAVHALATGFQAVCISNHGGRQLDSSPAPVRVLHSIRDAVGDEPTLILDGGILRGTDVLKAIALGANAVSFARPYLYGLAAAGEAGAKHAIQLIADSIRRDMILAGLGSISDIGPDLIGSFGELGERCKTRPIHLLT